MKRMLLFLVGILFLTSVPVNAVSDYYKDIIVTFNHNGCDQYANKEITIQLFADGQKVEGKEVKLNQSTGYTYTYEDLKIFDDHSPVEIKYDVKILENGKYRMISDKRYTYQTKHISKWVQILPKNIKAGHTYVITTDNWNYENNGFSKIIYLRGDITAKGAAVVPEYNIVDGSQSYYAIDGEPIENTKWTVSNVPTTDPNYNDFKDYLVFTNESGEKRLTLTGYKNGDNVNFIFRHTGKSGFNEGENSWNTNKMTLTNVPDSKGRFYIGTHNLWPDGNNNDMQYITLSGQNQYQAGADMERAAQFKAYEYIDKDVQTGVTINLEESICPKDTIVINKHSEYQRKITVKVNCSGCEYRKDNGILLQLFADGQKVEDESIKLDSKTGFTHTFDNLPVFQDDSFQEINYEVKGYINGKYYPILKKDISHQKKKVHKWIQVFPEDIKDGQTYILTTDNLNYAANGFSKIIYLRGDITAKGAAVIPEYNIIDNKKSYYVLDGEPVENSKWVVSKVPSTDPDYNEFKDYLMFTNEGGKNLTLTGYNGSSGINFIFKYSGKNGYIDSEDAMYTNKVLITSTKDAKGTFVIGTKNLFPEPNNMMQYLTLNGNNQFQAGTDIDNATKFKAFGLVDKEIVLESEILMSPSLCELYQRSIPNNPKTGYIIYAVTIILFTICGFSYYIYNQRKENVVEIKKVD